MKAAISIVLAGLLVTTPLKLVLAQADQQQSQSTTPQETSVAAPQDSTGAPAFVGVPALERGSSAALLWSAEATAPAADSLAYDLMYRRVSTVGWIVIGVVGAIVLLFAIATIVVCSEGTLSC